MNPNQIYELVSTPVCLIFVSLAVLAVFLKNSSKVDDWKIPFILGTVGFFLGAVFLGVNDKSKSIFEAFKSFFAGGLFGLIAAGVNVYGHQCLTQFMNRNKDINSEPPPPPQCPPSKTLALILIPFLMLSQGCATAPTAGNSTVAQSSDSIEKSFWDAMKGNAAKAGEFLKTPTAKNNAPLFFKMAWKASLAGYKAAGGDSEDLAKNAILPFCNAIASFTGGQGISTDQIEAAALAVGGNVDLSKYDPLAGVVNPVLEWVIQMLPDDPKLALFYIHAAAQSGMDVAGEFK